MITEKKEARLLRFKWVLLILTEHKKTSAVNFAVWRSWLAWILV